MGGSGDLILIPVFHIKLKRLTFIGGAKSIPVESSQFDGARVALFLQCLNEFFSSHPSGATFSIGKVMWKLYAIYLPCQEINELLSCVRQNNAAGLFERDCATAGI